MPVILWGFHRLAMAGAVMVDQLAKTDDFANRPRWLVVVQAASLRNLHHEKTNDETAKQEADQTDGMLFLFVFSSFVFS
jgi:hypothetical protein